MAKRAGDPNRPSHNNLNLLCRAWVQQNAPAVYQMFRKELGIKSKGVNPRLQAIIDKTANELAEKAEERALTKLQQQEEDNDHPARY